MRILSFTNLPPKAVYDHFGDPSAYLQGWVDGLISALSRYSDLELGFASVYKGEFSYFTVDNSTFFNIRPPTAHKFPRAWFDQWRHPIDFPDVIGQCLRIIDEYQPDVIHVNGTEGFFGLIQAYTDIPVVISIQGLLTLVQRSFFRGFEPVDLLKLLFTKDFIRGTGLVHQYWSMQKAASREIQIINSVGYFIGRTEFDRNFVNLYNPAAKYFHCDEVLRKEFYYAQWAGENCRRNSLYFVSGVNTYKGIDCIFEALALVKRSIKDIHLRISGAFPDSRLWPWITRKAIRLGITDNITWLGLSAPSEVAFEMEHAAVFVIPSYVDNSPNSLAEAMLVGTPCIASYVGGIPSMLTDHENGLLFPSGNYHALAGCILSVLRDKKLANKISENARLQAQTRHNPAHIAQRMVRIYTLLAHSAAKRADKSFEQDKAGMG